MFYQMEALKGLCLQCMHQFGSRDSFVRYFIFRGSKICTSTRKGRFYFAEAYPADLIANVLEQKYAMFNNTSSPENTFLTACGTIGDNRLKDFFSYEVAFSTSLAIVVLSPVAVTGNALILVIIWQRTFVRSSFHILLSGLAFTDLCTGLISQPFFAAAYFTYFATHEADCHRLKLAFTLRTIGASSALYFIGCTILLLTILSIERWLHMSRRSLATSRGGQYFAMILLLLTPIPAVVFRVFATKSQMYGNKMSIAIIAIVLICYLTMSFAYFKVYRIIRHHQLLVQANEASQNFGRQAIDLAKFKKSIATIIYILLLFSFCFLPYVVSSGVYISLKFSSEIFVVDRVTTVVLFLSPSLNPGLYLWRMNDIRSGVRHLFNSSS